MLRTPAVLVSCLWVSSIAAADPVVVDVAVDVDVAVHGAPGQVVARPAPEPPPPPAPRLGGGRWEVTLAGQLGRFAIDDVAGPQFGLQASLGRQLGPLRLAVDYGIAKFSAHRDLYDAGGWWDGWEDVGGEVRRIGASVRGRVGGDVESLDGKTHATLAGYLELGAGRQTILWSGGGEQTRRDVSLGLGLEIVGGRTHVGGFDLGVRFLASPKTGQMSEDRTHDLGVLVHLGAMLGS
jgi:hypothetical protein